MLLETHASFTKLLKSVKILLPKCYALYGKIEIALTELIDHENSRESKIYY